MSKTNRRKSEISAHPAKRGQPAPVKPGKKPWDPAGVLDNLSDAQQEQIAHHLVSSVSTTEIFSGPLPPPRDFAEYNKILPGAADRIVGMAEKEQQVRADNQKTILANDTRRIKGATALAIFLGGALFTVAGIVAWKGDPLIAAPVAVAGVLVSILRELRLWRESRTKPKA